MYKVFIWNQHPDYEKKDIFFEIVGPITSGNFNNPEGYQYQYEGVTINIDGTEFFNFNCWEETYDSVSINTTPIFCKCFDTFLSAYQYVLNRIKEI